MIILNSFDMIILNGTVWHIYLYVVTKKAEYLDRSDKMVVTFVKQICVYMSCL